jgi:hypothetical protein
LLAEGIGEGLGTAPALEQVERIGVAAIGAHNIGLR